METVFAFVEFYVSPLIFAIGLIFLFNGIINYFLIGVNFEEDRKEIGRQALLWAALLFIIGFAVFSVAHWFLSVSTQIKDRADVDLQSEEAVLPVPNVPSSR